MKRVILSTKLIIGDGTFEAKTITEAEAQAWVQSGEVENFCGHETTKVLGLEPDKSRRQCEGYDEALALSAKQRLEFGREYSMEEIKEIGVIFTLIKKR